MRRLYYVLGVGLSVLPLGATATATEEQTATTEYTLWVGGHYTDLEDYGKKVGEYDLGNDRVLPEFQLNLLSRTPGRYLSLSGHYYDDQNVSGRLQAVVGNRLSLDVQYRSLVRQLGQDLLSNINAKEAVGGKILSHEIQDPGADYNYNRHEILTRMNVLLSEKHDVRIVAAHRSILKKGEEQKLSNNHCWGCHVVSQGARLDTRTHALEAGLEAEVNEVDVGYQFAYRLFESEAAPAERYFDTASHPIDYLNPGRQAEFGSRLLYDDTVLAHGTYPETEKMTHKVRFKGDLGKGRFSSSLAYTTSENKQTEFSSDALSGAVHYATPLSERTRLVAKARAARISNDDPFIDLPIYRDGRPGPPWSRPDFDYTRYSGLDRLDAKLTAEVITRLNPRLTLSVLGGYERIDRDDYPLPDDGLTTNRMIGQAKVRYRKGLRYSSTLKYRFEKTSDPFTSGRGLFERAARDELSLPWNGTGATFAFIFYYEREGLRYQSITTEPTDYHEVDWRMTYRPHPKLNVNLGLRGMFDKNGDLDSLDVEHFSMQPNAAVTLIPSPKWSMTGGYTFHHNKSRGPVTVALFDG